MALTGTFLRALDEKQRLAVPKRLRTQFAAAEEEPSSLFVTPETERSLGLYSPEGFDQLAHQLAEKAAGRAEVRNYLRLFYSRAERVDLDSQGRIRIPERLIEYAGLKHEVMLLGVHDHAELWDRRLWEEFLSRHSAEFDQLAAKAFQ